MIEDSLVRIAVALERLVEQGEKNCGAMVIDHVQKEFAAAPVALYTATDPKAGLNAVTDPKADGSTVSGAGEVNHRIALMDVLKAKGISYNEKARTVTLEKMVLEASKVPAAAPEPVVEKAPEPAEEPPVVTMIINKDTVKDALINLSTAKTKDVALKIMKTIGGAEKLSEVDPSKYEAIILACRKEQGNG